MSGNGTAPISLKSISYHFDGTTEFIDNGVVTHRFPPGDYVEMLMLKLAGKHEKAKVFLDAAQLRGEMDARPHGFGGPEPPTDSPAPDHPATTPSGNQLGDEPLPL